MIRHGQTNWNEERRAQGQSDSVLTELGIKLGMSLGTAVGVALGGRVSRLVGETDGA